jgi:hypothetical protein
MGKQYVLIYCISAIVFRVYWRAINWGLSVKKAFSSGEGYSINQNLKKSVIDAPQHLQFILTHLVAFLTLFYAAICTKSQCRIYA